MPSNVAFDVMEKVRKGKKIPIEHVPVLKEHNVPDYYIEACNKIKYLYPKAHAVAYATMAVRVGYFKVYYPLEFYATFFSVRSKQYDIEVRKLIRNLEANIVENYEVNDISDIIVIPSPSDCTENNFSIECTNTTNSSLGYDIVLEKNSDKI